jgi:hypothetical protein
LVVYELILFGFLWATMLSVLGSKMGELYCVDVGWQSAGGYCWQCSYWQVEQEKNGTIVPGGTGWV